jgi:AraC family transcriptional regulator
MKDLKLNVRSGIEVMIRSEREDEIDLESLARAIAVHLGVSACLADAPGAQNGGGGLAPQKLERVCEFIDQHLGEALHVEQLAAVVHLSAFHFTRLFKQSTGWPPHAYITRRRMARARKLLAESRLALVDVAASVGFQTQGHFTEVFRRSTGLTPRRFRIVSNGRIATLPRTDGEESRQPDA